MLNMFLLNYSLVEAVVSIVKMWWQCATCVKLTFVLSQMHTYARFSVVLLVIRFVWLWCGCIFCEQVAKISVEYSIIWFPVVLLLFVL